MPAGRLELTRDIAAALVAATAAGLPRGPAAVAVGVTRADFRRWLARGRRGDDPECVRLEADVRRVTARTLAERIDQIHRAGKRGCWQALAWLLERRFPDLFGCDRKELAALRREVDALSDRLGRSGRGLTGGASPPG